jgi:hypothetical protein
MGQIINQSTLSHEFKAMAKANELHTFDDIISYGVTRLPELPLGNNRLLVELLGWLEENGLLELADKVQEVDS